MLPLARCVPSATAELRCNSSVAMFSVPTSTRHVRPAMQFRERRSGMAKRSSSPAHPRPRPRPRPRGVALAASSSPDTPSPSSTTIVLKVDGMVCSKCTDRVENALMAIGGVKDARADLATGEVKVEVDGGGDASSVSALAAAVEELGFGAAVA